MALCFISHLNRISMAVAGDERIMKQFSIAPEKMGAIYSAFLLVYTLCMIPGGFFIDRFGARTALRDVSFPASAGEIVAVIGPTAAAKTRRRSKLHEEHEEHVNHERWLITYADMITLLMVLFIVLYSISQVDLAKFRRLKEGVAGGFGGPAAAGALSGGAGPLQGGGGVFDSGLHGTQAVTSAQAAQAAQLPAAE